MKTVEEQQAEARGEMAAAATTAAAAPPAAETSTPASAAAGAGRVRFRDPRIEMAHGAGGKASRRLVEGLLVPLLAGAAGPLAAGPLADAAYLEVDGARLAFTADSFVVRPLRFPGGSIGELAVNGTVNDLAVSAARPLALLVTLVIEEGIETATLAAEVEAIGAAARRAGVQILGGDTKVVEHGKADGLYITTAGIGRLDARARCGPREVRPGDRVLLSGPIGDHGMTILLARGEIEIEAPLSSDTRSVYPMVERLLAAAPEGVHWMRDPTRGGVATALNELARDCGLGIVLGEEQIPVREAVRGACELLGLDPLHIANEGQFLAVVAADAADVALAAVRAVPGGEEAVFIGEVREAPARTVLAAASYGGTRVVDMLVGDPLPRIC
jgi:hydrogenase expression/formation protein HypE